MRKQKNMLTLVGLDIEGNWNVPLLKNAAEIFGASTVFARTDLPSGSTVAIEDKPGAAFEELLNRYDHILACETGKKSRNIYKFPAPRGHTALLVGNEVNGISREVLKKVSQVVSVPMFGRGMSSVNVAVAAAISLYVLERDLARNGTRSSRLSYRDIDILVQAPGDPSELGSLFRSVWAFGWQKVYLSDREDIWFTSNRKTVMAGRAAARREVNPLVISPSEHMNIQKYDKVILCNGNRSGTALSRLELPNRGKVLIILGEGNPHFLNEMSVEQVFLDHSNSKIKPSFRHMGSILLSVVSQMLHRDRHG